MEKLVQRKKELLFHLKLNLLLNSFGFEFSPVKEIFHLTRAFI